ncbi:uncharacterized protein V1513DRAFT_449114 [Lipomyces chichibuensis]|uniref:uncharacterized protein n=1 Tax=Lipomyces chichibuensis TaxID=1546026 RepID=UPI0033439396
MPVSLSNLLHTPRPRGRRRAAGTLQSPATFNEHSVTATSPITQLLWPTTSHHLNTKVGGSYTDGKGYSSVLSLPEIFHRLNPRYMFTRRHIIRDNTHKEKQAAIEAGVIYGTRTYDWGTGSASVKSPTSATFTATPTPDRASASTTRRGTIRRILQVSKSVLRTKPLPSLPSIISRQKAEPSRARTQIEVTTEFSTDLGDLSLGDRDALGITLSQPVGRSATAATHRTDMSTETRRRFSFDSSTNGSLLRNGSDASKATKVSIDPPLSVPEEDDIEHEDEQENEIVLPFPAKIYSAAELADITAFDFSDDRYDDMLIDEVNAYGAEDGFSSSDDSDLERAISHASLTPISEQTDEDGTPVSSPVMSSPMSAQSREVVAYVRGSRGWVVERRMRKGGWGYQVPGGEVEIGAEVEEELLATERVEWRAI